MVNRVAIVRDHSISMSNLASYALKDYNFVLEDIKNSQSSKIKSKLSVVECGVSYSSNLIGVPIKNIPVLEIPQISKYIASGGGTPLYDSVGLAIDTLLEGRQNKKDTYFVNVITDGFENYSRIYNAMSLSQRIKELQATDKWTFVFRVPVGHKRNLVKTLGLYEGNVIEWEQSSRGFEDVTRVTRASTQSYYNIVASGATSTRNFFTTDLSHINDKNLKASLVDVRNEVKFWNVKNDGENVRSFCESKSKQPFLKGAAFYQLVKTESKVQSYKLIAIREKMNGNVYVGDAARDILNLPKDKDIKLVPGDHGKYDVYIQSTSVNRKLPKGTNVLYWSNVGKTYKTGKSAA